ncbi:MAG: VCBS repeat-containing protein [Phycisphaerales bacterium]|nr:MAG: VCBS repeat-containing protein [Phycisphaerales bacterium]
MSAEKQIMAWSGALASAIASCAFTVSAEATKTKIYVEADAHVYSRYNAQPYGLTGMLYVGDWESVNKYSYTYVKFDLCNYVDVKINSAKLYLYCIGKYDGNLPTDSFECTYDDWLESTITWGSKPAWGTNSLSSATINAVNTWFNWDVTTAAQNCQTEDDGHITIMVKPSFNAIGDWCNFASYENSEGQTTDPYVEIDWQPKAQWDPVDWDLIIPTFNEFDLRDPQDAIDLGQWANQGPANSDTTIDCVYDLDDFLYFSDGAATTVYWYHRGGGYMGSYADESDGLQNVRGIHRYCGLFGIACGAYQADGPAGGRGAGGRVALFDGPHSFVGNLIEDDSDPYDFHVLPGGRVLLSDTTAGAGNVRLYESDHQTFNVLFYTEQPRQLAPMSSTGHYLVVSQGDGLVIEFDLEGNIHNTWPFPNGSGVFELGNGRLLLTNDEGTWSMNPADPGDLVQLAVGPGRFINATPTNSVACCFADGMCEDLMEDDCVAMGGVWQGYGTKCATFQCPEGPDEYVDWSQGISGVHYSDAQWGDLDNDGDLDLAICGVDNSDQIVTRIYENQAGSMVFAQDLAGVNNTGSGCLAWGDYDGDGDLDLAIAGMGEVERITRVYRNDAGYLTWDTDQVLTPVNTASLAWGDYDNDGDLDLVVTGNDGTNRVAIAYRNDPLGMLTPDPAQSLTGVVGGSVDFGDYDGDGDLDLVMTGYDGTVRRTIFYENDPVGTLTDDGDHGLPGANLSDTAWGDYDNDGDLDLAWVGETAAGGPRYARVYENDGAGNFSVFAELMNVYRSSCAWGDYDNDGDLDVAFSGYTGTSLQTYMFENTGGGFTQSFWFPDRYEGSLSFADVDQDYDLDFLVTGYDWYNAYADLYEKRGGYLNTPPDPPVILNAEPDEDGLHLYWYGASDFETPADGLYYCLRIGTGPGAHDVMSGTYGSPLIGNVHQAAELVLDLPPGEYYWSVQAIDSGLLASPWSEEMFSEIEVEVDCPADVNQDLVVNIDDLFAILGAWGPCDDCPEDVNDDGVVDIDDIFDVLAQWGPCP